MGYKNRVRNNKRQIMPLKLAFSNKQYSKRNRYPDTQTLMRRKTLRQTMRQYKLGCSVFVDHMPATVVAYNIAEFGRWISTSHPVMVRLVTGELIYCRLNEILPDADHWSGV